MFYDILKSLCDERGISPSRAATECGISRSTVTWWKQHKTNPNSEQISKLAIYFGVSTDYLLGNKQKEKASSLNEKKPEDITFDDFTYALLDESKELTEENKDKLLEMAKFFKQQQDKEKSKD